MSRVEFEAIGNPEFINMTQLSPLVSKGETKVCYVGQNRNHSYIDKQTMTSMGKTLPGCPIVGYYVEDKEDFADHGNQMIIDHNGITQKCLTKPYGFVPPDAKVWFQKFQETDEMGNTVEREYLMTECILWTSQFPECQRVIDEGNPQSMELDNSTLNGHWSQDVKSGVEFFIINDAMISKLCILGEDVEPCFEGANVTTQNISSTFTLSMDQQAVETMFSMVKELRKIFSNQEGGQKGMSKAKVENFENSQDKDLETSVSDFQNNTEEFAKEEDDKKKEEEKDTSYACSKEKDSDSNKEDEEDKKKKEFSSDEEDKSDFEKEENDSEFVKKEKEDDKKDSPEDNKDKKEDEDKKKDFTSDEEDDEDYALKYSELSAEYEKLKSEFAALKDTCDALSKYKSDIEDDQKDALIAEFYMLSDEDKKDVIDNKSKYSLDEIEAKLSVICRRKKVNFDLGEEKEDSAPMVYNLNQTQASTIPTWIQAVQDTKAKMQ